MDIVRIVFNKVLNMGHSGVGVNITRTKKTKILFACRRINKFIQ